MKSLTTTNLVTKLRNMTSLALVLVASLNSYGQERAQADVSVTSVTLAAVKVKPRMPAEISPTPQQPGLKPGPNPVPLDPVLRCTVTVFSQNDDDANQTMLVVVVPVEVSVVSVPANAIVHKAGGTSPFAGYLVFSLGNMAVGQSITVEFTFTKSVYGNKVGAYAYSASPDPNPANNYKDATF